MFVIAKYEEEAAQTQGQKRQWQRFKRQWRHIATAAATVKWWTRLAMPGLAAAAAAAIYERKEERRRCKWGSDLMLMRNGRV